MLKDRKTLWGNSIADLKVKHKKFLRLNAIGWTIEILLWISLVIIMVKRNVSAPSFFLTLLLISTLYIIISEKYINTFTTVAYQFYKKHCSDIIEEEYFNLDAQRLYSVIYCTGCKRLQENKSYEYYVDLIISLCNENISMSRKIMKYLIKYKVESEEANATLEIIRGKRNKIYFINFK